MLVSWATVQDLVLANTFADKERESIWTFRNGKRRARLDYLLLDRCLHNAGTCDVMTDIDIGSDHRPLCQVLSFRRARHTHGKQGHQSKRNYDGNIFKANCEAMLEQYPAQASSTNEKAKYLEKVLLESAGAASSGRKAPQRMRDGSLESGLDADIRALILERRANEADTSITDMIKKQRRTDICKQIKTLMRKRRVIKNSARVQEILGDFRGLKEIAGMKSPKRKESIAVMKNDGGQECYDESDIAEIFAIFYEKLYASNHPMARLSEPPQCPCKEIHHFTMDELTLGLKGMKNGKAKDQAGIVVEMMKASGEQFRAFMLDLFNEVLNPTKEPPES